MHPINLSDALGLDAGSVFLGGGSALGGAYRMTDAHNARTTDNAASSGSGVASTAPPQSPAKPTPPPRHKKPDSPGKKKPLWQNSNRPYDPGDVGFWPGLRKGAEATADGAIPFADPFAANGGYDPSDPNYQFSQAMGGVARDALLTAVVPNLGVWAKNPVAYEVGQTTLASGEFKALENLSAIERGAVLAEKNGGYLKAALSTSWPQTLKTVTTGLTPGGNIAGIAGVHVADHYIGE